MGFNPEVETKYLRGLPRAVRQRVLTDELSTAVQEAHLFSFQRTYRWEDFVVDPSSGERVGDILARGTVPAETQAWAAIENGLREGQTVVNFSPRNLDLHYPEPAVDFWQIDQDSQTVTWSRATVQDSFANITKVYQGLGGENVTNELEMLAKPIVLKETDPKTVLSKLSLVGEKVRVTALQIERVAEIIINDFEKKFGGNFVLNKEIVYRAYSAVMDKVRNMVRGRVTKILEDVRIGVQRLNDYAFAPMVNMIQKTFGCDFETTVGGFVNSAMGMLRGAVARVESIFGGKTFDCPNKKCQKPIPSGKGIEKCPHCGMTKQEAGSICD